MCRQFIMVPQDELTRIIQDVKARLAAEAAPAAQEAWPKSEVPLLVPGPAPGSLEVAVMRWGYPVTWQKDVVFNTRAETALGARDNMWADSLRRRRCIVPSYGFYECHRSEKTPSPKTGRPIKRPYHFTLPGSALVFMAGIYSEGHFSIMTTAPNPWMQPVHDRMPVVLRPQELEGWLGADFAPLLDRSGIELAARPA